MLKPSSEGHGLSIFILPYYWMKTTGKVLVSIQLNNESHNTSHIGNTFNPFNSFKCSVHFEILNFGFFSSIHCNIISKHGSFEHKALQ